VPDLTQEGVPGVPPGLNGAICLAAAAADALWYFDHLEVDGKRRYRGLVQHTKAKNSATNWGKDGYRLVKDLADAIYVQGEGWNGVLRYIYARRGDQDVSRETRTVRRGRGEVPITQSYFKWGYDLRSEAAVNNDGIRQAVEGPAQFGIAMAEWHEQGKPAGAYMKAGETIIAHHLAVAGRDSEDRQLVVAHGWGDHWLVSDNKAVPVSNAYYDAYDYRIEDGGMRITDGDLIDRVAGLDGRKPDYAQVTQLGLLSPERRVDFSVVAPKEPPPARPLDADGEGAEARAHLEFVAYNLSGIHLNRLALELPLLAPEEFSVEALSDVVLPPGWGYRAWDPDVDVAAPQLGTDQGIANWLGYGFMGVLFETDFDYVSPDSGLAIGFDLPADLLDWTALSSGPLSAAAWTPSGEVAYVGLAVPMEEPPSLLLVAPGLAVLAARSRRRPRRRERPIAPGPDHPRAV
jgi:hypothetical protein